MQIQAFFSVRFVRLAFSCANASYSDYHQRFCSNQWIFLKTKWHLNATISKKIWQRKIYLLIFYIYLHRCFCDDNHYINGSSLHATCLCDVKNYLVKIFDVYVECLTEHVLITKYIFIAIVSNIRWMKTSYICQFLKKIVSCVKS